MFCALFQNYLSIVPLSKFMDEQQTQFPSLTLNNSMVFGRWSSTLFFFFVILLMNVYFYIHSSFGVEHVVCFMYEQISLVYIVHVIFMVLSVVCPLMKTFYIVLFA